MGIVLPFHCQDTIASSVDNGPKGILGQQVEAETSELRWAGVSWGIGAGWSLEVGGDAANVGLARDLEATFAASQASPFSVYYCFFFI